MKVKGTKTMKQDQIETNRIKREDTEKMMREEEIGRVKRQQRAAAERER